MKTGSATSLPSELRDKPAPIVKGRAYKIKPDRKVAEPKELPPAPIGELPRKRGPHPDAFPKARALPVKLSVRPQQRNS